MFGMYPFLAKLFADGGDQGPNSASLGPGAATPHGRDRETFGSGERVRGLPLRWVVERLWRGSIAAVASPRTSKT